MDEWMMDGSMGGWIEGWMDNSRIEGWMDGWSSTVKKSCTKKVTLELRQKLTRTWIDEKAKGKQSYRRNTKRKTHGCEDFGEYQGK